jgi:O-antigen/teichoic acid export membrane protein
MNITSNKNIVSLLFFSLGSFLLSYATAIVFARAMGVNGYDDYAVAVSSLTILATLAEMGTGKYALRIIPAYRNNKFWSLSKGYFRYSFSLILIISLILVSITKIFGYIENGIFGSYVLGIGILFLPVIAWVGAGSEFIIANMAIIRSALVTRLLVPGITLLLGIFWVQSHNEISSIQGILFYGFGWVIGLFAIIFLLQKTVQTGILKAKAGYYSRDWTTNILPFLFFALLITTLTKVGVIVLEIVRPQEATVAIYAVAAETGAFIYLIAKSIDKMFLPDVSVLIERKDIDGLRSIQKYRLLWLGPACTLFLLVIFFFGKRILSLFGPEFISGYPALCIIAVSTSVWTMASLTPVFLKYIGKYHLVIVLTTLSVIAHIGLCFLLGYYYGSTGAALSFAIPVILLYISMSVFARYHLRKEMKV